MNNYSKIYWLTRLDNFHVLLMTIIAISLFVIAAIALESIIESDFDNCYEYDEQKERKERRKKYLKQLRWIVPLCIISVMFKVFLPTQKEAIIIIAGGKTIDYVQSDTSLQKIPQQTTKIISEYLDKTLNEIKENK